MQSASDNKSSFELPYRILRAMMFAFFLAWYEWVKAHRSSIWPGADASEWYGAFLGLLVYSAGILILDILITLLLRCIRIRRFPVAYVLCVILAIYVYVMDVVYLEASTYSAILAACVLSAGAVFLDIARYRTHRWCGLALMFALCSGAMLTASSVNRLFLLHTDRVTLVTVSSLMFFLFGSVISALLLVPARRLYSLGVAILLVAFPFASHLWPLSFSIGPASGSPNLIFITTDAMRADYCSVYGGNTPTPAFETIADKGVLFEYAYALSPWTLPSMVGLFSSTYPYDLQPDTPEDRYLEELGRIRIDQDNQTLAELLKANGYATAGFTGNTLLQGPNGMLRGFDTTAVIGHRTVVRTGPLAVFPMLGVTAHTLHPSFAPERPVDTSRLLLRYALHFIHKNKGKPFFLWVHFMDPHTAFDPPERYRTLEGPLPVFCNADPKWGWTDHPRDPETDDLLLTPEEQRYVRSLYEGEIRYVDECIGSIWYEIHRMQLNDSTVFAITSDHGEEFWDHGRFGHGHNLYQELVHVPLLMAGPDIPENIRIHEPWSHIHLIPALCSLLGKPAPTSWQGISIPLENPDFIPPPSFMLGANPFVSTEPLRAVVYRHRKLIEGQESGMLKFFDLGNDPEEQNPLDTQDDPFIHELQELLRSWGDSLTDTVKDDRISEQEILDQLEQVGYL